jgi:predicted nuclease with TOPRIM domain
MIEVSHLILLEKISVLCTMSSPEQTVYRLGQKIKALLFELEDLKRQNEDLKNKLSNSFEENGILVARVKELERMEEQTLIAAAIGGNSDAEREQARKKMNALVREIDQCIALLNG